MAITKMMHMKASSKARIDIHLEHSINYILQPKSLGKQIWQAVSTACRRWLTGR